MTFSKHSFNPRWWSLMFSFLTVDVVNAKTDVCMCVCVLRLTELSRSMLGIRILSQESSKLLRVKNKTKQTCEIPTSQLQKKYSSVYVYSCASLYPSACANWTLVMLVKVVCPNIDLCVCVPRNNRNAFELDQAGEKMLGLTQAAW